jgi:hypothetical protein
MSEVDAEEFTPESRWEVSGVLEINCMGCHNAARIQSHSEWAKQIMRENFRWAATAASGLGEVGGMASRLPVTWDVMDGTNPDDTEWAVVPNVSYRPELFDSQHRVFFDIGDKVDDQRCLACHSATPAGRSRYQVTQDVHASAGIRCVDCHRHDVTHRMARGYAGEAEEYARPEAAAFSCRGCHLGEDGPHGKTGTAGHLGAPRPRHAGFPAVHFERLSCTVCHSGPVPDKEGTRVRTSRANRLGIYGIANWATDFPHIQEPVMVRDARGLLVPNRLMWPSYWFRVDDGSIIPLPPQEVSERGGGILDHVEDIATILAVLSLNPDLGGVAVLVVRGRMFTPNLDGGLDVSALPEGSGMEEGRLWALRTEMGLAPLFPGFDPQAEEPDPEIEVRIQLIRPTFRVNPAAFPACSGRTEIPSSLWFRISFSGPSRRSWGGRRPSPRNRSGACWRGCPRRGENTATSREVGSSGWTKPAGSRLPSMRRRNRSPGRWPIPCGRPSSPWASRSARSVTGKDLLSSSER